MSESESLFDQLWRNHPALQSPPVIAPCATGGIANFDNQCAIRLGLCLINSGISLASYRGTCCWYGHGKTHPIRAVRGNLVLEDGVMNAWSLPIVLVIGACYCTPVVNADTSISSPETPQPSSAIPEYTVSGHTFRVTATATGCTLVHGTGDSATTNLQLDLEPPCYLLTWHHPAPRGKSDPGTSDAEPVGTIGEPMGWRYASPAATIALVVLGDSPKPEILSSSLYRLRSRQGMHCAPSLQGIRIRDNAVSLSPVRKHVGLFCDEIGLEERDFWLLAHDRVPLPGGLDHNPSH